MSHKSIFISPTESVKEVLKKLDKTSEKVLLVVDQNTKLLGAVTDGDIRRFLLKGGELNSGIESIYNRSPKSIKEKNYSLELVKKILLKEKIELLPVIDSDGVVIKFVTWDEAFAQTDTTWIDPIKIDLPIVIMAGGKGTRLEPFTKILPKPLIPVSNKALVEIIIDEFRKQGARDYYLTLNYKGEMIESYFNSIEKDYNLSFVWEKDYYGTAGCLDLFKTKFNGNFIVSNCDVLVRANFEEVIEFHKQQDACLTILSSIQHHKLPYGVINFKNGGEVTNIVEKPEYTFTINTGVYVLSQKALQYVPSNVCFNMTDLIDVLIKNNQRVITFPVNENDYIDVGQWDEYKRVIQLFEGR